MGYEKKEMPADFSEHWTEKLSVLRVRYHVSERVIHRWKEELGHIVTRKHPVNQYTLDGKFVKQYDSIGEAAEAMYGRMGYISACANGRVKTAYGYIWKLASEDSEVE